MAKIEDIDWEIFSGNRLKSCRRAVFLAEVPSQTYDSFFNSPFGYRAQYARGVECGEQANRLLINTLTTDMISVAVRESASDINLIRRSLAADDAKIWICESEVEDHMGDDAPEINYAPWQMASKTAWCNGVGLRAPVGTKIEIKGGWLDQQGLVQGDQYKADRSQDIHDFGFS